MILNQKKSKIFEIAKKICNNKKARVFTAPRDTLSFFIGLLLTAFGILPLLAKWGMVKFTIPFIGNLAVDVLIWIVALAGAYVVIDGFIEPPAYSLHWILILIGSILLIVGLIPILSNLKIIGFNIPLGDMIYRIIITVEGILLVIGGLTEH
jgi:hypothetical protein